jgi:hypothetical protein
LKLFRSFDIEIYELLRLRLGEFGVFEKSVDFLLGLWLPLIVFGELEVGVFVRSLLSFGFFGFGFISE